jgi:protein SCO1
MPPSGGGGAGGPGGPEGGPDGGYSTDEEGKEFESDRRFSNYIMFIGSFTMMVIFMMANVVQLKRQKEEKKKSLEPTSSTTKYTGKADIGGNWLLYDTKGEPVTHKDLAGKYYLIYFGFTFCPDVCPVSLMKMAKAMNIVKASKEYSYFDLDAIFVSVDPDRDTNERIEEYCKIFDPSIKGLTHKSNDN